MGAIDNAEVRKPSRPTRARPYVDHVDEGGNRMQRDRQVPHHRLTRHHA
jgi:hypothetical protein